MDAPAVTVEVHLANGLPAFTIVGLADTEVRESRDRVRAALHNAGFDFPPDISPSILHPRIYPKSQGASICRLRWAYWPHPVRYPPQNWMTTNLQVNCRSRESFGPYERRWR